MSLRTGFYFNPIYLQHNTGNHPENAGRLQFLVEAMEKNPALADLLRVEAGKAELAQVSSIHDTDYIASVEQACEQGLPYLGTMDCQISEKTYEVALHATGAVLEAAMKIADQQLDNAFCAVRPPGHHAEIDEAMGFCYFNNVAVAAEFLVREYGYQRILIFDFDVHHGNGTQHTFEERPDVFFSSIHQDPRTCYPGTGFHSEKGRGDGIGTTLNCPMPPFSGDDEYLQAFSSTLLPRFEAYRPDFIILSAGFDAHRDDPLAQENLTVRGFNHMLEGIKQLAYRHAGGRILSVLEGGYDYEALAHSIQSHLEILLEDPQ